MSDTGESLERINDDLEVYHCNFCNKYTCNDSDKDCVLCGLSRTNASVGLTEKQDIEN